MWCLAWESGTEKDINQKLKKSEEVWTFFDKNTNISPLIVTILPY